MIPRILKNAVRYFFHNPAQFFDSILTRLWFLFPSDKLYLSLRFRCKMGYWMNWKNPRTFSEKLQWLKLYNRKPEYTTMVDKYAVKDYVARLIGEEYIIPTLGVWEKPEDIEWDKLPNKFVLKTTHGGGSCGVIICRDKAGFDKQKTIKKLKKALRSDIYSAYREWPYKNVLRRIIAEALLEESPNESVGDLTDYKFFCFNGEPTYCQVIQGRHDCLTIDFYDMEWNHLPFIGLNPAAKPSPNPVAKPSGLKVFQSVAKKLSNGINFSRIDFYEVNGKVYFGEITFFPASGFGVFVPKEWNHILGELIKRKR